jgi:hypothetical protein
MPRRSYEDFERAITQFQVAPTPAMLEDLIAGTIDVEPDEIDEEMTGFARSRIELAFRTGRVQTHLRHLYDVLAVVESKLAGE